MPSRSERIIDQARRVADYLDRVGQHKYANDIRALCASSAAMRGTIRRDGLPMPASPPAPTWPTPALPPVASAAPSLPRIEHRPQPRRRAPTLEEQLARIAAGATIVTVHPLKGPSHA